VPPTLLLLLLRHHLLLLLHLLLLRLPCVHLEAVVLLIMHCLLLWYSGAAITTAALGTAHSRQYPRCHMGTTCSPNCTAHLASCTASVVPPTLLLLLLLHHHLLLLLLLLLLVRLPCAHLTAVVLLQQLAGANCILQLDLNLVLVLLFCTAAAAPAAAAAADFCLLEQQRACGLHQS
jgi:hypothetical protein